MPHYAILIYSDTTADHDAAELAEHDEHSADLIRSGALTAAYALGSATAARSIRGSGITDGPYTESKELIAGIGIIEAPDVDAALTLASRNPATRHGAGVEVREIEFSYIRDANDPAADLTAG